MYIQRQVTSKIGGGITYDFADPIDYGSTPIIRALGGILLRAESGDLPTVLGCQILPTVLACFLQSLALQVSPHAVKEIYLCLLWH